jgi:hypothetical protein
MNLKDEKNMFTFNEDDIVAKDNAKEIVKVIDGKLL